MSRDGSKLEVVAGGFRAPSVVRFPLSFDSGIMRPRFNPSDGQLYVAGMRGWQTTGVRDGCLQRVRWTGRPTRMPLGIRVRKGGLDLEFAEPVDREIAADAESWSAQVFHVESTADYGSPEYRVSDRKKRGREPLEAQLTGSPGEPTRHRKLLVGLEPPFEAVPPVWELSVGEFRVFYDIDEKEQAVHVRAVRRKPPHKTTEEIL